MFSLAYFRHTRTHTHTHAHAYTNTHRGVEECRKVLKEEFSIEASDADCEAARRICEAVSTRAARLAAAGIVALVKKINKLDGCSVAVDGSLYKKHPKFASK